MPNIEGAKQQVRGPNVESLLKDRNDDDGAKSIFGAPGADVIGSNSSLIGAEKPGDVAIRINKINIAINPD